MLILLQILVLYSPLVSTDALFEEYLRMGKIAYTGILMPIHYHFESEPLNKHYNYLDSKLLINVGFEHRDSNVLWLYPFFQHKHKNFGLVVEPLLKIGDQTIWPYILWEEYFTAGYSRAYLYYNNNNLFLNLGRNRLAMGLETLMDDKDTPFDHFLIKYSGKHFQGFYFIGEFDYQTPQDTSSYYTKGKTYRRFITGHGIESRFWKLTGGFTEVALFYNEANSPYCYWYNPLILYHPQLWDMGGAGEQNVFWMLFLNYWGRKVSAHSEVVIDDFQYHPTSPGYWPHKLAWSFRVNVKDPFLKPSFLKLEYSGINRWTYNHGIPILRWTNRREIMGKFRDNDMDSLSLSLTKYKDYHSLIVSCGYVRKGVGHVMEKDTFYTNSNGYPQGVFLSPIQHKGCFLSLSYCLIRNNFGIKPSILFSNERPTVGEHSNYFTIQFEVFYYPLKERS